MKFVFLVTALAIASPALPSQELVVTSNLSDQAVEPSFVITLNLSRPLPATEGRLAVLIGQTDVSSLFTPTGASFSYLPRIVPLPAGESPVRIFLVSPSNEWRELTQLMLRVKALAIAAAQSTPLAAGQSAPPAPDPAQAEKAKQYGFTPKLTLGMKSQMAARYFPDSNRPERSIVSKIRGAMNDVSEEASYSV